MRIIKLTANENGARPGLQSWTGDTLPDGYAVCPEEFAKTFYSTSPAGFVNITVADNTVVEMTINQEALDAYVAENPEQPDTEPEPASGNASYDDLAAAITEGVNMV